MNAIRTLNFRHADEGVEWTLTHPDGTQSSARMNRISPLIWRVTLNRTYPAGHPIECEGFGAQTVFGSYRRAKRKAISLLDRWDLVHSDIVDAYERWEREIDV